MFWKFIRKCGKNSVTTTATIMNLSITELVNRLANASEVVRVAYVKAIREH